MEKKQNMAKSTECAKTSVDMCVYSLDNIQSRRSASGIAFDSGFISFIKTESFISKDDVLNTAYIEQLADLETSHESIYSLEHHFKKMFDSPNQENGDAFVKTSLPANRVQHNTVTNETVNATCISSTKENQNPIKTVIEDKGGCGKDDLCDVLHSKAGFGAVTEYLENCHISSPTPSTSRLPLLPSLYNVPEDNPQKVRESTCLNKTDKNLTSEVKYVSAVTNKASLNSHNNIKHQKLSQKSQCRKAQNVRYFPPLYKSDKPFHVSIPSSQLNTSSKVSGQVNVQKKYNSASSLLSKNRNSITSGKKLPTVAPDKSHETAERNNPKSKSELESQKNVLKSVNRFSFSRASTKPLLHSKKLQSDTYQEAKAATTETASHNLNRLSMKSNSKPKIPTLIKKTPSQRIPPPMPPYKKVTPKRKKVITRTLEKQTNVAVKRVTSTTISRKFSPKIKLRAKNIKSSQKTNLAISSLPANKKVHVESQKPSASTSKAINEPSVRKVNGSFSNFPGRADSRLEQLPCTSKTQKVSLLANKKSRKEKVSNVAEKTVNRAKNIVDPTSAACFKNTELCYSLTANNTPKQSSMKAETYFNSMSEYDELTDVEESNLTMHKIFCTSDKSFRKSKIKVHNLEMVPHVLESELKHLHPFLETGSYNSSLIGYSFDEYQGTVKQNRVTFCPQLSTIHEIDSPFPSSCEELLLDLENVFPQEHANKECNNSPVPLWSKHVNMSNDSSVPRQTVYNKQNTSFLTKLKETSSSSRTSKDSFAFQSLELVTPSTEHKNMDNTPPPIHKTLVRNVISVKSLKGNMPETSRLKLSYSLHGLKEYEDISKGILEESDLTLIGSELTISMMHEECGPLNHKESTVPVQLAEYASPAQETISNSLMSFLQHEISCMNSADSVVSLIHPTS